MHTRYDIDVVVSRYKEDLGWVFRLPPHANLYAYNKGSDISFAQPLPNVGREAHTYLHHILSFYNKLPNTEADYICFLQGNPFDHCKETVEVITSGIYRGRDFTPLGNFRVDCDLNGAPHHPGLKLKEFGNVLRREMPEKLTFTAGAQFVIHKRVLQHYPIGYFLDLFINSIVHEEVPYLLERTWELMFTQTPYAVRPTNEAKEEREATEGKA